MGLAYPLDIPGPLSPTQRSETYPTHPTVSLHLDSDSTPTSPPDRLRRRRSQPPQPPPLPPPPPPVGARGRSTATHVLVSRCPVRRLFSTPPRFRSRSASPPARI
ncbi:hypothetical protein DAI22_03g364100 [Oryza sativa Japonica Group]|nr:hypothetical protein DAI22_03g364100 [Oryza sativa Japonica Group]